MYDLTGVEVAAHARAIAAARRRRSISMLARPEAEQLVATIIHEATHQIAFNSGLQTRFADIPLWVSEGIAVYFETPDLQSAKGWRTIGAVNDSRLDRFREYLRTRPADSLKSLIADDKRIRDTRTALDAYAEAWALNYYLIHQHPKQYVAYLQMLSDKKQLLWDDPATRLQGVSGRLRRQPGPARRRLSAADAKGALSVELTCTLDAVLLRLMAHFSAPVALSCGRRPLVIIEARFRTLTRPTATRPHYPASRNAPP